MAENLPYRSKTTWLGDGDLVLLDVLFDGGAELRLLRQENFHAQWNLGYSHGFNNLDLECRVRWLCDQGVLETDLCYGRTIYRMTVAGGHLWSEARSMHV